MSLSSPTKSNSNGLIFTKNIRLNLNSKFIPDDFFPSSISLSRKNRKTIEKQYQTLSTHKPPTKINQNQDSFYSGKTKNLELLRKRLIKINQEPTSNIHQSKGIIFSKVNSVARKEQSSLSRNAKLVQLSGNGQNNKLKRVSKKMVDYMQKMKNTIDIDFGFHDNLISPTYRTNLDEKIKQKQDDDVETDDSPKIQRFRPRTEFRNRKKVQSHQRVSIELNKPVPNALRTKTKEVKLQKKQKQQEKIKKSKRYRQFDDIQLNQDGMLTFYGSFNQNINSYDSRKYSARSSLPKLQK